MKNKKEISKKEYILYFVIVLCVMALAIALVAVAAILQKIGVNNVVYTVIGLSSFPILIFGVVFAVLKLGKMQKYGRSYRTQYRGREPCGWYCRHKLYGILRPLLL